MVTSVEYDGDAYMGAIYIGCIEQDLQDVYNSDDV